jgi:hypothetical protein
MSTGTATIVPGERAGIVAKNPPRSIEGYGFPIAAESLDLE